MGIKFGEILYELRKNNDLTQQDMANDFAVSAKTISKWENGIFEPNFEMLEKIADYFKVAPDYLLGYDKQVKGAEVITNIERKALVSFRGLDMIDQMEAIGFMNGVRIKKQKDKKARQANK